MTPNTIVQYWNTPELPKDIAELVGTWKAYNPSMEHKLFSYEDACAFIGQYYNNEVESLFKLAALPAMQSDIFRVAYCLKMGGFYVDCGIKCKAPIQPLLSNDLLFLVRKWHGGIMNGAIGCRAGHPALEWIWNRILQNLKERNSNDVWRLTGPLSFNQMVESGEFESSLSIVEQANTKPFFDIVNELEHKKKHWSKEQEKQSVFLEQVESSKSKTFQSDEVVSINKVEDTTAKRVEFPLIVFTKCFERASIKRLFIDVSLLKLSSGFDKKFTVIINKRGKRTEVEFAKPNSKRYFPLTSFISSGNNGVTDYMLIMPEKIENNTFFKLSLQDKRDLITIILKVSQAIKNNSLESYFGFNKEEEYCWDKDIEDLLYNFEKALKTSQAIEENIEQKVKVNNLKLVEENTLTKPDIIIGGDLKEHGKKNDVPFTLHLVADESMKDLQYIFVKDECLLPMKNNILLAVSKKIHKMSLNGKKLITTTELWFKLIKKYIGEDN